jgi:hypothetical protein
MTILICTVLFCLGWRMVTDDGQLLYFIKEPFESNYKRMTGLIQLQETDFSDTRQHEINQRKTLNYLGKPFVLCITCMASIWGVTIFYFFHVVMSQPFGHYWFLELTFNCIAASFIQTFIWDLYDKFL